MIPTAIHWTCGQGLPDADEYRDHVVVLRDVSFDRTGEEPHRRMDVYRPIGGGRGPTCLCWYGGAFIGGRKEAMSRVAAYLASHGMAAVTPNYRLGQPAAGVAAWPKALLDARAAAEFVREKADELRLNGETVVGLGHSSGAYLAMMCGFVPDGVWMRLGSCADRVGLGPQRRVSGRILDAVVNIAGVTDRRGVVSPSQLALLGRGYENQPDLQAEASVLTYVGPHGPRVYTLHGDADKMVSVDQARKLDEALQAAGVAHTSDIVPGAGHDPVTKITLSAIRDWINKANE